MRERIEDRRATAVRVLDSLATDFDAIVDSARDSNGDDEHDTDGSTIAFERSQVESLIASTRRTIDDLDAALERLDAGTYGVCDRCGQPIPIERMEARPASTTCVVCLTR